MVRRPVDGLPNLPRPAVYTQTASSFESALPERKRSTTWPKMDSTHLDSHTSIVLDFVQLDGSQHPDGFDYQHCAHHTPMCFLFKQYSVQMLEGTRRSEISDFEDIKMRFGSFAHMVTQPMSMYRGVVAGILRTHPRALIGFASEC